VVPERGAQALPHRVDSGLNGIGPPQEWDGTEAVFENPQHDFPRRIIYRKQPDNVVVVRIDGGAGTKGEDFTFKP